TTPGESRDSTHRSPQGLTPLRAIDAWPKIGPTMRVHDVACRGSRGAGRSGSRPRRARGRGPPDRGRGLTAPGSTGAPSPACSARRVQEVEHRLDDWLVGLPRSVSPEPDRLDNHIRAHRGEWLVFLHDAEVPPTNNHAEQMLRPAVITRKIARCNKNLPGAPVHSIFARLTGRPH